MVKKGNNLSFCISSCIFMEAGSLGHFLSGEVSSDPLNVLFSGPFLALPALPFVLCGCSVTPPRGCGTHEMMFKIPSPGGQGFQGFIWGPVSN